MYKKKYSQIAFYGIFLIKYCPPLTAPSSLFSLIRDQCLTHRHLHLLSVNVPAVVGVVLAEEA